MDIYVNDKIFYMSNIAGLQEPPNKTCNIFGIYIPSKLKEEIDTIRGDIPRSRWLRKAAIKELELQRKEKEKLLLLQQGLCSVGPQLSHDVVAATTNQPPVVVPEGSDSNG